MDINGKKGPTDNPCVGVCSTTLGDALCRGCGRSQQQITQWPTYTQADKLRINTQLQQTAQRKRAILKLQQQKRESKNMTLEQEIDSKLNETLTYLFGVTLEEALEIIKTEGGV